jgi:single-strand DNA-binding protein
MPSLNKAQIIGNLGSDPEVRSTSSGTRVATLSVATNRSWTDDQGRQHDEVEWHRVTLWERLAEVAEEYLAKGDRVYVEGRLTTDKWEGDDGVTRQRTKIVGRRLLMLGSSSGSGSRSRGGGGGANRSQAAGPGKPTKEDKRVPGARRQDRDDDLSQFSDDALMGDNSLPF